MACTAASRGIGRLAEGLTSMKSLLLCLSCSTLGFGLGITYFFVLRHNAGAEVEGALGSRTLLLRAVRLLATGAAFWWLAQYGALPALLALLGFLAAQQPLLREALDAYDLPRSSS